MNWEIIAATGEWAGAIAVVASLLYLARQIHHATKQAKAAARFSFLDAYGETNAAIFQSKQSASVYRRGLLGDLDDSDERAQFMCMLANFLNTWSVLYDLHTENELPDNQWELVQKDIRAMFNMPGGREFWETTGAEAMNQSFVEAVKTILDTEEEPYTLMTD